jgi:5-methylcytosine-specific restriction enzyme subunit McrC
LEIHPKVDLAPSGVEDPVVAGQSLAALLAGAGWLPSVESAAGVSSLKCSLLDALCLCFGRRLARELERGVDHQYSVEVVNTEDVRGRILFAEDIRANAGLHHRCVHARDVFAPDTQLNRVLKATCRQLLRSVQLRDARLALVRALEVLDDVADRSADQLLAHWPTLTRGSQRFADVLAFCHAVLNQMSPGQTSGSQTNFSLLFPMERAFEAFVGRLLKKALQPLGYFVKLQSGAFLMRDESNQPRFKLRPDIVILRGKEVVAIADTKWKRLKEPGAARSISSGDVYQMLAYARQWSAPRTVLLYPRTSDDVGADYTRGVGGDSWKLSTRFVNLARNLSQARERAALAQELVEAIGELAGSPT